MTETCLKRYLFDDKNDVFWIGFGFGPALSCGAYLDGQLDVEGTKLREEGGL